MAKWCVFVGEVETRVERDADGMRLPPFVHNY
jgi:hypothetical protein